MILGFCSMSTPMQAESIRSDGPTFRARNWLQLVRTENRQYKTPISATHCPRDDGGDPTDSQLTMVRLVARSIVRKGMVEKLKSNAEAD
jgi:hypothetical protein